MKAREGAGSGMRFGSGNSYMLMVVQALVVVAAVASPFVFFSSGEQAWGARGSVFCNLR